MKVYVYQIGDLGWDNVVGVYSSEDKVLQFINQEQNLEDQYDNLEDALDYYEGWVREFEVDAYL